MPPENPVVQENDEPVVIEISQGSSQQITRAVREKVVDDDGNVYVKYDVEEINWEEEEFLGSRREGIKAPTK